MSIQVICPLLAGNGPAPCSNTTIKKLHEFFDHGGFEALTLERVTTALRASPSLRFVGLLLTL